MIRFTEEFVSAQEISESLIDKGKLDEDQAHDAWLALTVLWERWLPEKPSLEGIDDWMQKGYEHAGKGDSAGACRAWLIAWKSILEILDKRSIKTLDEFDDLFQGTQSAFNWVQDFEMELGNAGIDEKDFLLDRISLCTEYENRFGSKDGLTAENMRRALAESYFKLGEREKADALFGKWLDADPQWGWGWIGWADCYAFFGGDVPRGIEILNQGLSVLGVRDREDILERLRDYRNESAPNTGRDMEASRLPGGKARTELQKSKKKKRKDAKAARKKNRR
jgi:tetratricopeptide (TPR) repeat protein